MSLTNSSAEKVKTSIEWWKTFLKTTYWKISSFPYKWLENFDTSL